MSPAAMPTRAVQAFAPASIGNFAAGFDLLGAALAPLDGTLLGDVVQVEPAAADSFRLTGPYAHLLAGDGRKNLVVGAYELFRQRMADKGQACGPFALTLNKRLPLNSGMGSSASSIVATLTALQACCGEPMTPRELLDMAGTVEGLYSGAIHWDNVAPSLRGGLQLVVPGADGSGTARSLPWPGSALLVVVHPEFALATAHSRAALPPAWPTETAVAFAGNLAGFVLALHSQDLHLLERCLRDPLAEPYRASLVPGFREAQAAALAAGALGCSLSGSGPSIFAVAPEADAERVAQGITGAFAAAGLESQSWICGLDTQGARILP
jgi:homoserine kinase